LVPPPTYWLGVVAILVYALKVFVILLNYAFVVAGVRQD
jgi:hypothetical protein